MIPKYIIIHHSASPQSQTAKAIDDYHKAKWNFRSALGHYAGYQYIIESNGNIFQARKDTEAGAHTIQENMNYQSIGICLTGWYDDGHDNLPTEKQQESLGKLLENKMKEWNIPRENIKFHRDYAPKTCPGLHINQKLISNIIKPMSEINEEFLKIAKVVGVDAGDKVNDNEAKRIRKEVVKIAENNAELLKLYISTLSERDNARRELLVKESQLKQCKELNKSLSKDLNDAADKIEIMTETVKDIEEDLRKDSRGKIINIFDLGKWRIVIKDISKVRPGKLIN